MREIKQILLANRAWAAEMIDENPDFFARQVAGQKPDFLWIGCSDSRVSPEQITQTLPGGMFIHRNVANLVDVDDLNLMSVVQYAVDVLQVPDIVLCGHYGCSQLAATLHGGTEGPVDAWLDNARSVYHDHRDEIDGCGTDEARVNRFVEINVCDQLVRLARSEIIQNAFRRGQKLELHGWVYDLRDGLLKPLMEVDRETALETLGKPERVLSPSEDLPLAAE